MRSARDCPRWPFIGLSLLALGVLPAGCGATAMKVQNAIGRSDQAYLLEQLQESEDEWIVEDAAKGLGDLGHRPAVPALVKLLSDPGAGPYRRSAAAYALGRIGDPGSARPLMAALEAAADPEERYWVIFGLYNVCRGKNKLAVMSALQQASTSSDVILARAARKGIFECSGGQRKKQPQPAPMPAAPARPEPARRLPAIKASAESPAPAPAKASAPRPAPSSDQAADDEEVN